MLSFNTSWVPKTDGGRKGDPGSSSSAAMKARKSARSASRSSALHSKPVLTALQPTTYSPTNGAPIPVWRRMLDPIQRKELQYILRQAKQKNKLDASPAPEPLNLIQPKRAGHKLMRTTLDAIVAVGGLSFSPLKHHPYRNLIMKMESSDAYIQSLCQTLPILEEVMQRWWKSTTSASNLLIDKYSGITLYSKIIQVLVLPITLGRISRQSISPTYLEGATTVVDLRIKAAAEADWNYDSHQRKCLTYRRLCMYLFDLSTLWCQDEYGITINVPNIPERVMFLDMLYSVIVGANASPTSSPRNQQGDPQQDSSSSSAAALQPKPEEPLPCLSDFSPKSPNVNAGSVAEGSAVGARPPTSPSSHVATNYFPATFRLHAGTPVAPFSRPQTTPVVGSTDLLGLPRASTSHQHLRRGEAILSSLSYQEPEDSFVSHNLYSNFPIRQLVDRPVSSAESTSMNFGSTPQHRVQHKFTPQHRPKPKSPPQKYARRLSEALNATQGVVLRLPSYSQALSLLTLPPRVIIYQNYAATNTIDSKKPASAAEKENGTHGPPPSVLPAQAKNVPSVAARSTKMTDSTPTATITIPDSSLPSTPYGDLPTVTSSGSLATEGSHTDKAVSGYESSMSSSGGFAVKAMPTTTKSRPPSFVVATTPSSSGTALPPPPPPPLPLPQDERKPSSSGVDKAPATSQQVRRQSQSGQLPPTGNSQKSTLRISSVTPSSQPGSSSSTLPSPQQIPFELTYEDPSTHSTALLKGSLTPGVTTYTHILRHANAGADAEPPKLFGIGSDGEPLTSKPVPIASQEEFDNFVHSMVHRSGSISGVDGTNSVYSPLIRLKME